MQIEVRGDPHGVFRPREGGLTRIRCFRVVVLSCRVVVVGSGRAARARGLGPGGSGQGARARNPKNRQKSTKIKNVQNDPK